MTLASSVRLGLGFAACAAVLVAATVWGAVPPQYGPCPQDPAEPLTISHCVLGPSRLVAVLKLVVSLLAIVGASVYVATTALRFRVIGGAAAASLCSLLGLLAQYAVISQTFDEGLKPWLSAAAVVACVFFLFGALVAWVSTRLWPNKSLERTREG